MDTALPLTSVKQYLQFSVGSANELPAMVMPATEAALSRSMDSI